MATAALRCFAEAHRERQVPRLVVEQPEERVGVAPDDGLGLPLGDHLDLDPALGGAHQQDPPVGPVEDGGQVELLDDVRRRADEDLADGHALDVHAEDGRGDLGGLVDRARELHATGLAPATDQDLGLDHDLPADRTRGEEATGGGAGLVDGVGDLPGWDRQALGDEQRLRVGFLDLHGRGRLRVRPGSGA